MALIGRIQKAQQGAVAPADVDKQSPVDTTTRQRAPRAPELAPARQELLRDVRLRLRDEVIGSFNSRMDVSNATEVRTKIEEVVDRIVGAQGFALVRAERLRLIEDLIDELTGLGPLEPFLLDPTITEVMVNGPRQIYIERAGKLELTNVVFQDDEHVMRIIDRIIAPLGRRIDESSPRVDARLADGSRVNAIIAPLSLVGPVITIRKFSATPFTVDDLVGFGTATLDMFDFLKACVEARLNIFVSGGTGSGKTTTLNVLSSFIPNDERIVTIEDAAELQLRQEHVVTLESRPANIEGLGEITIRDLLRNALHMRPDRVIVGECRSGEALDMLQAMTTGQDGSLSTGHSNSPRDMLSRLETMVLMAGYELPLRSIREQIASAVDLIVHTARLKDGTRKVVNITEVYGVEDDEILTQDIFAFEQTGVVDGKIQGTLKPTGIRPTFMGQFKASGIRLPRGEYGIPAEDPDHPTPAGKRRWAADQVAAAAVSHLAIGYSPAVTAGGMIYISAMGPVDPETGQIVGNSVSDQASQCLANLKARLEAAGSSLNKVVWATWSLRDTGDLEGFNEAWMHWFNGAGPIGQGGLMGTAQRRAGFRVSIGVIAEA